VGDDYGRHDDSSSEENSCVSDGFIPDEDHQRCFQILSIPVAFEQAQPNCRSQGSDWNFFVPLDNVDLHSAADIALSGITKDHWLGMKYDEAGAFDYNCDSLTWYPTNVTGGPGECLM
ncbi:hypothetical protein SK128_023071, partial [Halocaridina rubra]